MTDSVLREVGGDTPEAAEVMELVNMWRAIFSAAQKAANGGATDAVDVDSLSHAITASAVMGGMYFGNVIIGGLATDKDRRRATEAFARNFRTGIDIGKRQGLRVAAEMPVGGHA